MILMSPLLSPYISVALFFFFNDSATTEIYTLSLHDALPIFTHMKMKTAPVVMFDEMTIGCIRTLVRLKNRGRMRSEEHTSELQSRVDLVCRLLLEKKKKKK